MCQLCRPAGTATRRTMLGLFGGAAVLARHAVAAEPKTPPKPQNVVSPDRALELLMAGNARYAAGVARRHDFAHEREKLAGGQNPYAAILGCADSRIAPEYAFDSARGDLFVCRVAGNFANTDVVASFEYAVAILNVPLIMVLGHDACGAVEATVKSVRDHTTLPGHLPSLVAALAPAVEASASQPGDPLANAIRENVILNVRMLRTATPIVSAAVDQGKLHIVGAIYRLADGHVTPVSA